MADKKIHSINVWPMEFGGIRDGNQRVFFAPHEANYNLGDLIRFQECEDPHMYEDEDGAQIRNRYSMAPTGRTCDVEVTHIFTRHKQALQPGMAALSIRVMEDAADARSYHQTTLD